MVLLVYESPRWVFELHNNEGVTYKNSYAQVSKGMSQKVRDEEMHDTFSSDGEYFILPKPYLNQDTAYQLLPSAVHRLVWKVAPLIKDNETLLWPFWP